MVSPLSPARGAMRERGLQPDTSGAAQAVVGAARGFFIDFRKAG